MKFEDEKSSHSQLDSKNFIRLKDGESVKGVFRGEPYRFYRHWNGKHSVDCGKDTGSTCEYCARGEKPAFRFRLNFLVKDDHGNYTPKIFEQGWTVYSTLKALHGSDYDLEKTHVKVSRSGTSVHDTTYTIIPLPNGLVTAEQDKRLSQMKLLDLKGTQEPQGKTSVMDQPSMTEEDIPF